jgi:RNA polymerase sigma factor (sigma-70 family)
MHLTDKNLVDKVLKGDSQAFGIIIKNTEGLVAQIVFKMIPNTEDRKDLVQNIYLKAFHKLSSFKFQSKLSTWIAQIAYNNCLSHLEKKKLVLPGGGHDKDGSGEDTLALLSSRYGMDSYGGTEQFIDQKELSGILQVEINSLPPVYKTLISLYHQEELSYEEMVEITGLPEGTVKSYLFRARKMLKENLLAKYKKEAL